MSSTRLVLLKATTAQRTSYTPVPAEILYDTDLGQFYGGDGSTAGGVAIGATLTNEQVEDIIGGLIGDSTTIDVTYNDAGNVMSMDVIPSALNTNDFNNDANFQTDAQVTSAVNAHANLTNNPHGVTKSQVGLGNVDNTSDLNKPISTATQTALDLKADASSVPTSLDDLTDVDLTGLANGDILQYNSTSSVFEVNGLSSTGGIKEYQFFTGTVSFTNNDPTYISVYTYNTSSLDIGTYVVKWFWTYEPGNTSSNDLFHIAENTTALSNQVDFEDEGKDTGSDIKRTAFVIGELVVTAAGTKQLNLRGAQDGGGTTVVKGSYVEIIKVA